MSDLKHHPLPSDELLVAFLDGELEGDERRRIDTLIKTDPVVGERYAFLSRSEMPFYDAFEPLLENAPTSDLEAMLAKLPSPIAAEPKPRGWSRRSFIAAAVALVFAGVLADRTYLQFEDESEEQDGSAWRDVVAEYLTLYTPDTLADVASDADAQVQQLRNVGDKLGLNLPMSAMALPGVDFKRAQMLQYDGRPLAQIAYLDPTHGPMALCIVASKRGASAPQVEERYGMNVVYWSDQSHGFMLVGHNPPEQLSTLAEKLRSAINT